TASLPARTSSRSPAPKSPARSSRRPRKRRKPSSSSASPRPPAIWPRATSRTSAARKKRQSRRATRSNPNCDQRLGPARLSRAHFFRGREMTTIDEIFEAARRLTTDERVALADRLLATVSPEEQAEIDAAWAEEIERRIAAYERGEVKTIPVEEV